MAADPRSPGDGPELTDYGVLKSPQDTLGFCRIWSFGGLRSESGRNMQDLVSHAFEFHVLWQYRAFGLDVGLTVGPHA